MPTYNAHAHIRQWRDSDNAWGIVQKAEGKIQMITSPLNMQSNAIWFPRWMLTFKSLENKGLNQLPFEERSIFLFRSILMRCGPTLQPQCWEWSGATNNTRPIQIYMNLRLHPLKALASILSGNIAPKEFKYRRYCDNPQCMNPRHLILDAYNINTPLPYEYARKWQSHDHYPWAPMTNANLITEESYPRIVPLNTPRDSEPGDSAPAPIDYNNLTADPGFKLTPSKKPAEESESSHGDH